MAVRDASVFPSFSKAVSTFLASQSRPPLFSHKSEVRDEKSQERRARVRQNPIPTPTPATLVKGVKEICNGYFIRPRIRKVM